MIGLSGCSAGEQRRVLDRGVKTRYKGGAMQDSSGASSTWTLAGLVEAAVCARTGTATMTAQTRPL
jgi:hypothetical protein